MCVVCLCSPQISLRALRIWHSIQPVRVATWLPLGRENCRALCVRACNTVAEETEAIDAAEHFHVHAASATDRTV